MKLKPILARPAPAVIARSPNIGPNDGAALVNARVTGSKVNVNPPAEEPIGAVDTSRPTRSAMTSPMFVTPLPSPAALVNCTSTWRGDRPLLPCVVWAPAWAPTRSTAQTATTARGAYDCCDIPTPAGFTNGGDADYNRRRG